jgi:glycosyltransferase involved in cell wall biosynthesis
MLSHITPLLLTFNEAPNIGRTLERLRWATEVVVVDSLSSDGTQSIARGFLNVRLLERRFDSHTAQWNFGLAQVRTPFVLALDADYLVSDELLQEIRALPAATPLVAWFAPFRYCILGRTLRGALYPKRAVLFRRDCCHYQQDGHTQLLKINGPAGELRGFIDHDDRKPLSHWLSAQQKYAALEVVKLLGTSFSELRPVDRIRKLIVPAPFLVFFYTLLGKGLILDGWAGWAYVLQRTLAEMILSLQLVEAKLNRQRPSALPAPSAPVSTVPSAVPRSSRADRDVTTSLKG